MTTITAGQFRLPQGVVIAASLLSVGAAAYTAYKIWQKISNPNKGTPFEGSGVVGTAGNIVNQTLGGAPAAIGSALADKFYSFFHPADSEDDTFFSVLFIGGDGKFSERHSVRAGDVSEDGYFIRLGKKYRLKVDAESRKYAIPQ